VSHADGLGPHLEHRAYHAQEFVVAKRGRDPGQPLLLVDGTPASPTIAIGNHEQARPAVSSAMAVSPHQTPNGADAP
jgi:hypothetical protein